jgi:SNF2 family DNA or RNA helicase
LVAIQLPAARFPGRRGPVPPPVSHAHRKGNDASRREILARRIGPFVLRRRKEDVAAELPPKTEIRQNVELSGAQRDLYETIRLAMHARVQAEVQSKGYVARAHYHS